MKIRPMEAELFHVDGRTDMTKLPVVLRNFAKMLKNKRRNTTLISRTTMSTLSEGRQKIKAGSDSNATGPHLFPCGKSGTQVISGDKIEDHSSE